MIFQYKKNDLYCEGVSLKSIAKSTGTPVYVYSRQAFLDHYELIADAFKTIDSLICYSVKANSNLTVLRNLVYEGCGLDIVSGGELYRAINAGCDPSCIVYSGVGKSDDEIIFAIRTGIFMFNIESEPEYLRILSIANKLKKTVNAALRVNPDVDPKTHKYVTTGKKENKFGIDLNTAKKIYFKSMKNKRVKLRGVHVHIGSQITRVDPFVKAVKKVRAFIQTLRKGGVKIDVLNIGGGLGIVYKDEKPHTVKTFADNILPLVNDLGVRLLLEPGRFIAGNSGVFVTKVLHVKKSGKKYFAIVDGAMNDLLRPSLYGAHHEIVSVERKKGTMVADVVGPICESGDFLAKERKIAKVQTGDLLACMSAGAYGFAMSSNYNSRPRATEVMVDKKGYFIIRRRETYQDLIRNEL